MNVDRIKYWLSVGAEPSGHMARLLRKVRTPAACSPRSVLTGGQFNSRRTSRPRKEETPPPQKHRRQKGPGRLGSTEGINQRGKQEGDRSVETRQEAGPRQNTSPLVDRSPITNQNHGRCPRTRRPSPPRIPVQRSRCYPRKTLPRFSHRTKRLAHPTTRFQSLARMDLPRRPKSDIRRPIPNPPPGVSRTNHAPTFLRRLFPPETRSRRGA